MPAQLKGKVCAITGTGGSIGPAPTLASAREGAFVLSSTTTSVDAAHTSFDLGPGSRGDKPSQQPCQLTDPADCQALVASLAPKHTVVVLDRNGDVAVDLADADDVGRAAELVLERYGRCDVVLRAAATLGFGPLEKVKLHTWRQIEAVNVESTLVLTQPFVPGIQERRVDRVIFIVSNTFWSPPDGRHRRGWWRVCRRRSDRDPDQEATCAGHLHRRRRARRGNRPASRWSTPSRRSDLGDRKHRHHDAPAAFERLRDTSTAKILVAPTVHDARHQLDHATRATTHKVPSAAIDIAGLTVKCAALLRDEGGSGDETARCH